MKKLMNCFSLIAVFVIALFNVGLPLAHAAFNPNLIINDSVFNNASSMSAGQINTWLNTNFPSSCISTNNGFVSPDPTGYNPSAGYTYGGNVSGGQVIADAAQAYGINPQVLLATLQKESSVVSGTASYRCAYINTAMGYGCPDSGSCPTNPATMSGFSKQVIHAAWLFKFGQQRALGNTGWNVQLNNAPQAGDHWDNSDDPPTCYAGPMTQGVLKRCNTGSAVSYDGYTTIDGTSVHIDSGATAALYWYTPHFSGNTNFSNLFTGWFGNPTTACAGGANVSGAASGSKVIAYQYPASGPTRLALSQMNNTGSTCAETHVWNSGYQSWLTHVATGMRATDPAGGTLVANTKNANASAGITGLTFVAYSGGGGTAEIHKFSPDMQKFPGYYDVATNLSGVSAASGTFVAGDFFGRGYDQLAYILYSGSGGMAEVHMFDPTLRTAIGYYDVATNLSGVSAASGTFVAGDFFGRGYDQLAYVVYSGGGGQAEVHMFDPSLRKAIGYYDVSTNLSGVTATSGTFVAGDFLGRGYGQLDYVLYGGVGRQVESHLFSPDLRRAIGYQDIATNLAGFDPTQ